MLSLPLVYYVISLDNGNMCIVYCKHILIDKYKFSHALKYNSHHICMAWHLIHISYFIYCCFYFIDPHWILLKHITGNDR